MKSNPSFSFSLICPRSMNEARRRWVVEVEVDVEVQVVVHAGKILEDLQGTPGEEMRFMFATLHA